jgi:general secretion pathway protein I
VSASRQCQGFTLVEVLVALMVVAVGLGAVFLSLNQNIYNATYLRDKTIASWVAENRLTELRLADQTPEIDETTGDSEMADIRWLWIQNVTETGVANLLRVDITVSSELEPDSPLITVSGFVGVPIPVNDSDDDWAGAADARE